MNLFLVLLLGCLAQYIDCKDGFAFEFNATITNSEPGLPECSGISDNCTKYIELLCKWLTVTLPNFFYDKKPTICKATPLSNRTSEQSMDWHIYIQLSSEVSTALNINPDCPTFEQLYNHSINLVSRLPFTVKILDFSPRPTPIDPKSITDQSYIVNGRLYDYGKPLNKSTWVRPDNETLLEELRYLQLQNIMTKFLYRNRMVIFSNVTIRFQNYDVFIEYVLTIPRELSIKLQINPLCDVTNILQFSLRYDIERILYQFDEKATVALPSVPISTTVEVPTQGGKQSASNPEASGSAEPSNPGASVDASTSNPGASVDASTSTTNFGCIARFSFKTLLLTSFLFHTLKTLDRN